MNYINEGGFQENIQHAYIHGSLILNKGQMEAPNKNKIFFSVA